MNLAKVVVVRNNLHDFIDSLAKCGDECLTTRRGCMSRKNGKVFINQE